MQFHSLLLLCSALLGIAYSFPTGTENIKTTTLPHNETTTTNTKGNKKPLVFIMEERDPKSDSVIVQFVYSSNGGNSVIESKNSDKDKYVVDHVNHKEKQVEKSNLNMKEKEKHEEKSNVNEKEKEKHKEKSNMYAKEKKKHEEFVQLKQKEKLAQKRNIEKAAPGKFIKPKTSSTEDTQMMDVPTLTQDEISPLSGKWPKYDVLNPVPPFPELQFGKSNKMNPNKVQKESSDSYLPSPTNERKEQLNVAGPPLYPLSIYDREFDIPIFG